MRGEHKPHRSKRPYALRGLLFCGICDRRMQGHWANGAPYYRCRFPNEYALANRVRHPLNVTLRQDAVLDPLDAWLARKLAPRHLAGTIEELAAAPPSTRPRTRTGTEIAAKIAQCDRKLAQYRATLDAGGDPAVVARWITETEAERASYQAMKRPTSQRPPMSREEITAIVNTLRRPACSRPRSRPSRQGGDLRAARPQAHVPATEPNRPRRGAAERRSPLAFRECPRGDLNRSPISSPLVRHRG